MWPLVVEQRWGRRSWPKSSKGLTGGVGPMGEKHEGTEPYLWVVSGGSEMAYGGGAMWTGSERQWWTAAAL